MNQSFQWIATCSFVAHTCETSVSNSFQSRFRFWQARLGQQSVSDCTLQFCCLWACSTSRQNIQKCWPCSVYYRSIPISLFLRINLSICNCPIASFSILLILDNIGINLSVLSKDIVRISLME